MFRLIGFRWLLFLLVSSEVFAIAVEDALPAVSKDQVQSGQLLFEQANSKAFLQAPMLQSSAEINIKGIVANVNVTQSFQNTTKQWQHASYVFPLPENAAINQFRMRVGEREIVGEIKEKKAAKAIYEQAKTKGKKAALMRQYRANLFSTRVANIPPGESIEVNFEYFQQIDYESGELKIHFPMTITPRFQPQQPLDNQYAEDALPEMLYRQTDGENSSGPGQKIDLTVNLDAGSELRFVKSLNHSMMIQASDLGRYKLELKDHRLDKDFALVWQYKNRPLPQLINFNDEFQGDRYGLLLVIPPQLGNGNETESTDSRELILIIDSSGSMSGNSIVQARAAALYALQTLGDNDTFQIIEFDNNARKLFSSPRPATQQNKQVAKRWINRLKANGGTNIASAFNLVFNSDGSERSTGELQQVVFLTDGAVGNEAELFRHIEKNLGNRRLFTVGLGSAPNRYFMKRAAIIGRGSYQIINDPKNLAEEMSRLFKKLSHPVLSNLYLQLDNQNVEIDYSPNPIPELYAGEPLVLTYRIASNTAEGKESSTADGILSGTLMGQEWRQAIGDLNAAQLENHLTPEDYSSVSALATLWARAQIADMHQQLMLYDDTSQKQKITDLALRFSLVSPFTSFVAVEQQVSRPSGTDASNKQIVNNLPSGQRLPGTALNWQWQFYAGLLLAFVSVLMWLLSRWRLSAVS